MRRNFMADNRYNFYSRGYNDIDASNIVKSDSRKENGSVYYLVNDSNRAIEQSSNAAVIYCLTCNNMTIRSLNLPHTAYGILLDNSTGIRVEGSRLTDNMVGMSLHSCNDSHLEGNSILSNEQDGLEIIASKNNSIQRNNISNNEENGLVLADSSGNDISFNSMASNLGSGIRLNYSRQNSLQSNH